MENATEEERQKMWEMGRENDIKMSVEERMTGIQNNPDPYLFKMVEHPESEKMLKIYEGFLRRQNRSAIMDFYERFYTDPDPQVESLRQIKCPTLVLIGEFDIVFLKPSEIMAKEIPDSRHVIIPGLGHMTAIEDPERFIEELLDFLDTVKKSGRANR